MICSDLGGCSTRGSAGLVHFGILSGGEDDMYKIRASLPLTREENLNRVRLLRIGPRGCRMPGESREVGAGRRATRRRFTKVGLILVRASRVAIQQIRRLPVPEHGVPTHG